MREVDEGQKQAIGLIHIAFDKFTNEKGRLYLQMLADIPADTLQAAVYQLLNTSKYAPSIAEIRAKAEEITGIATGSTDYTAGMAWESVQRAIRKVGGYGRPKFSDPICAKVVSQIGWMDLCMTEIAMVPTVRSQFIKMYEREAGRVKSEEQIRELIPAQKLSQIAANVERLAIRGGEEK